MTDTPKNILKEVALHDENIVKKVALSDTPKIERLKEVISLAHKLGWIANRSVLSYPNGKSDGSYLPMHIYLVAICILYQAVFLLA